MYNQNLSKKFSQIFFDKSILKNIDSSKKKITEFYFDGKLKFIIYLFVALVFVSSYHYRHVRRARLNTISF